MPGFFNSKVLQLIQQDKDNLWSYINKPTAEMYEKVKHMRVMNLKTKRPQFITPKHKI